MGGAARRAFMAGDGQTFFALQALERRVLFAAARIAVIGDYGSAGPAELSVSQMVNGWDTAATPLDAVVTTGDNNYDDGDWSTIDSNVGQYFSKYIGNYKGAYGAGAATNKFFPVPGNHDWDSTVDHDGDGARALDPYLDYF